MTHRPFEVVAELAHGVVTAHPWGIALDGLLASQLWAELSATGAPGLQWPSQTSNPPDLDLPLARCHHDPQLWHWAATCSWSPAPCTEVRSWTGRLDQTATAAVAPSLPKNLPAGRGRYRTRQGPLFATVTDRLVWRGVGDVDGVRRLLTPLAAIGKKRSHGEGRVLRWSVTSLDDVDDWSAAHLHPDMTLGRPCPEACAPGHSGARGTAGIRPPTMHPGRQVELCLPLEVAP